MSVAVRFAALALALLGAPTAAMAGPAPAPAVEFRWDAPPGCPSEAEVVAQLERLLGGPLAERRGARLTAIARVRQEPGGAWDLRLWTVSEQGTLQRSLVHERCDMLASAGVFIAAMAIDPLAGERMVDGAEVAAVVAEAQPVPDPEPPPQVEPEPEPPPELPRIEPTPTPPMIEPPRQSALRGGLRLSAGVAYGDLPGVGPTLRLTPSLVWPRLRIELEGAYMPLRKTREASDSSRGVDLQLAAGALRACPVFHFFKKILEFPICGGVEFGAMYGRGVGYPIEKDARQLWAALHLMPMLLLQVHRRVVLFAGVEGFVALARPRFEVEGAGALYRAPAGGVRGHLGVEVRFP
ncbi:MAG: hypothetical protein H0T76_18575 [Nannocystis sp.]|nr:hypothetical protein [Nannocystis sp.]MBA3548492.1 hypothetical protein [Nannocystis sp.]